MTREPGRAPPRHAHGDLTSLAPGLPGAPQDEAGLTRKFETSHVGGATGRTPPIPRSAIEKVETGFVLYLLLFLQISKLDWDNWGTWNTLHFLHFMTGTATAYATGRSLPAQPETITCPRLLTDDYFYP